MDLRTRILRPGQDISLCKFSEDNLETTFHVGAILDGKIVANGTFMQFIHKDFSNAKNPYRLRGMATDKPFQGLGLGQMILQHAEIILKSKNSDLLWCNARESAFVFYEKNGFSYSGEMFDIQGVGPHKVMYKWL